MSHTRFGRMAVAAVALIGIACTDTGTPTAPRKLLSPRANPHSGDGTPISRGGVAPIVIAHFGGNGTQICNDSRVNSTEDVWNGFKVDDPKDGSFDGITWNTHDGEAGLYQATNAYLDWSAAGRTVRAVIVKDGADDQHVYYYNPPAFSDDQDLRGTLNNGGNIGALSHFVFCYTGGGGQQQGSSVVTEVHDADHEEVDNDNPAALGSSVHDQATVTSTFGADIPAGSTVTFFFWSNSNSCTGEPTYTSAPIPVSGASPQVVDNGLPQGPLGAGSYSYQANFTSGDPTLVDDSEGACEPFKVAKGTLHITTTVHNASHEDITNGNTPLGSVVHDVATVTGAVENFDPANSVTFKFFTNATCYGAGTGVAANGPDGAGTKSVDSDPLAAGSYSYIASLEGDDNYTVVDDTGCEPFTVDKASTTISTTPHDASHASILNGSVPAGSYVHDVATVGTKVGDFAITGTVTFKLYANSSCTGYPIATETVDLGNDVTDGTRSSAFLLMVVGAYGYSATYNGNDNYLASGNADCEPFAGAAPGKTQGFWGNVNGQARLAAETAFSAANAVTLGTNTGDNTRCWVVVNSAAKSLAIFPSSLNGLSQIPQCDAANERDSGINANSLNNLLSQTLALSYNIKYITNYSGFTIGALGCTAVSPLTSGSSVAAVRDYANSLIANAIKNNGSSTVTQSQIGAMNTLLGCLNREA